MFFLLLPNYFWSFTAWIFMSMGSMSFLLLGLLILLASNLKPFLETARIFRHRQTLQKFKYIVFLVVTSWDGISYVVWKHSCQKILYILYGNLDCRLLRLCVTYHISILIAVNKLNIQHSTKTDKLNNNLSRNNKISQLRYMFCLV